MNCLFCQSTKITNSVFEDTIFNEKSFSYVKCTDCKLIFLSPLPDADDLIKMYPLEYQGELIKISDGLYNNLFHKISQHTTSKEIVDYGCGNGRFLIEAISKNYRVIGIEFNPKFVKKLKTEFPSEVFFTVKEFFDSTQKHNLIFLSNVLEHLTAPREVMKSLINKLNPGGLIILEGPIENNFNLALIFRKTFFSIRKAMFRKKLNHSPYHIFFSNYKNQLMFFETLGLKTLLYKIDENPWPFPSFWKEYKSVDKKIQFVIAKISIAFSKWFRNSGNVFIYIGKFSD